MPFKKKQKGKAQNAGERTEEEGMKGRGRRGKEERGRGMREGERKERGEILEGRRSIDRDRVLSRKRIQFFSGNRSGRGRGGPSENVRAASATNRLSFRSDRSTRLFRENILHGREGSCSTNNHLQRYPETIPNFKKLIFFLQLKKIYSEFFHIF